MFVWLFDSYAKLRREVVWYETALGERQHTWILSFELRLRGYWKSEWIIYSPGSCVQHVRLGLADPLLAVWFSIGQLRRPLLTVSIIHLSWPPVYVRSRFSGGFHTPHYIYFDIASAASAPSDPIVGKAALSFAKYRKRERVSQSSPPLHHQHISIRTSPAI